MSIKNISIIILITYGSLLFPRICAAQNSKSSKVNLAGTKIPCFKLRNGNWVEVSDSECVMLTTKQYRNFVDRLVQLDTYKNKVISKSKEIEKKYKTLDQQWKISLETWKVQQKQFNIIIGSNQEQKKYWKDAFDKLQKQKFPKKHWTENPVLWFSLGAITAVGVTIGVAFIINKAN
jgi:hypothetical protein